MIETNQFDKEAMASLQKSINDSMIWGDLLPDNRTDFKKFEDKCKMGMVKIDGKQEMLNIDPETMKAYKTGSWYSLVDPIEEVKYDSFDRWCRGMDF